MPIRAGELNQRVHLYRVNTTRGSAGEVIESDEAVAEVWAKVEAGGGTQAERGGGQLARQALQITIRKRPEVGPTWKVAWRGRFYIVENVAEPFDGLNEYLVLSVYGDEVAVPE